VGEQTRRRIDFAGNLTSHSDSLPGDVGAFRPHALLHFAGHIVVAHADSAVAQDARLALYHRHPERVAELVAEVGRSCCALGYKARANKAMPAGSMRRIVDARVVVRERGRTWAGSTARSRR
jgi:hypothetical protein